MSNNSVMLQGWLEIHPEQAERVDGQTVIQARLKAGREYMGQHHAVVLTGRPAELALQRAAGRAIRIQAVVAGRLITTWREGQPIAWVAARRVDFFGEPMPLAASSA